MRPNKPLSTALLHPGAEGLQRGMLQGSSAKEVGAQQASLVPVLPGIGVHGAGPRERWQVSLMLGDPSGSHGPHGTALHPSPKLPSSAASPTHLWLHLAARAAPAFAELGMLGTVLPMPHAATHSLGLRQGQPSDLPGTPLHVGLPWSKSPRTRAGGDVRCDCACPRVGTGTLQTGHQKQAGQELGTLTCRAKQTDC